MDIITSNMKAWKLKEKTFIIGVDYAEPMRTKKQ